MNTSVSAMVEPLVNRKMFATQEEAVRSLLREYILQQVSQLQQELSSLENKYGMSFEQFAAYVHERSVLLEEGVSPTSNGRPWVRPLCKRKRIGWTGRSIGRCWRAGWGFARRLWLDVDAGSSGQAGGRSSSTPDLSRRTRGRDEGILARPVLLQDQGGARRRVLVAGPHLSQPRTH